MVFTETNLKGAFVIELKKLEDERGFFSRAWCNEETGNFALTNSIVQANMSFSKHKGTLRGLHYQKSPFQEGKYLRCIRGKIFDVIVDLRKDSPTFLKWFGVELSAENRKMIYAPENFAHGFVTLEDNSEVHYLVTKPYHGQAEKGIRWNDPTIGIEWPEKIVHVSDKDANIPDINISDLGL